MYGFVHSIESFGTVDGPGVRLVVFMQGCPMRCLYCHNPDTWRVGVGDMTSTDEIISAFNKNRAFYKNGGITVTGGEPLLQTEFLIELFKKAKKENIHTCIDTSGVTYSEREDNLKLLDELLSLTDLVMLDIKHIDNDEHKKLTSRKNVNILAFAKHLSERGIPTWVRHVVVPGITDNEEHLARLGEFLKELPALRALDVIPYHTLGRTKYTSLGIPYELEGVRDATSEDVARAKRIILNAYRKQ